jgi:hypothetical protein
MTTRIGTHLLLAIGLVISGSTQAQTVVCGGTISVLAYHQPSMLLLQLSSVNAPVIICSVDQEGVVPGAPTRNTSPAACRAIYASLLSAKASGTKTKSLCLDGSDVPASCNSFVN